MTPFAWLLGFVLPACGFTGAQGLPAPALLDLGQLHRPASPNTALAAPARTAADIVTPIYPAPAQRLYAEVIAVAADQPRTFVAAEFPAARQIHFVVRSALLNFPDLVTAQVSDAGPGASTLALYSRSVYGYSDLGANRQRLSAWLAALQVRINPKAER